MNAAGPWTAAATLPEDPKRHCLVEVLNMRNQERKATPKRLREMEQLLNTLAAVGRAREWKGKWAGV